MSESTLSPRSAGPDAMTDTCPASDWEQVQADPIGHIAIRIPRCPIAVLYAIQDVAEYATDNNLTEAEADQLANAMRALVGLEPLGTE